MKRAEKRDHLINVATALFNRLGYHAAGIDQVIAEAGIAKTTLYRHFPSKDDLIVAVLKRVDEQFREDMRNTVERAPGSPEDKLLATFDFLEEWFKGETFYGCPFISAASEHSDHGNPIFREAAMHKRLLIAYFEELARTAGLDRPKELAEEINLLQEGAIAVAHITGDRQAARKAKDAARKLLEGRR
jgi:AcrR family transcriptional regulator